MRDESHLAPVCMWSGSIANAGQMLISSFKSALLWLSKLAISKCQMQVRAGSDTITAFARFCFKSLGRAQCFAIGLLVVWHALHGCQHNMHFAVSGYIQPWFVAICWMAA